ncbi:hypothetical protein VT84_30640 [Gemmata sp. SH-PL17]|uniref:hypothetical protein n=1 Tax=Gemmata sp. SH-PL17 TaxID=1630693 RepID=UPI00078CF20B|nr:hypothetical protein [Gemmata sp. SH-PL17]AMV28791.1 hypothetical protein VT84_30640 [Gemmata sp. SH-PL17]
MPAIEPPDAATIATWEIRERGVRDGGSPVETFEGSSSHAERTFFCKWEHRGEVVKWMLGHAIVWDDSGTLKLSRLPAQVHPNFPGLICTKCTSIRGHRWIDNAVPIDPDPDIGYEFSAAQINEFENAELVFQYESMPFPNLPDDDEQVIVNGEVARYCSTDQYDVSGEYLQLPGAAFVWQRGTAAAPNGQSIPMNVGKIMPSAVVSVTWWRLPDEVWAPGSALWQRVFGSDEGDDPFLGKINSAEMFGMPQGCVLFSGIKPVRRRSPLGDGFEWDVTFEFSFKPSGWNWVYFMDPTTHTNSGFYFVGKPGSGVQPADVLDDGVSIYNSIDLNDLFKVS